MATPGRPQLAANYYLAPPEVSVAQFMRHARDAGAEGIGLTLAALEAHRPEELAKLAADHGLFISTLNSAGYFLSGDADACARQDALNIRLIDAAARMGAGRLVVIAGGIIGSGLSLEAARRRVAQSLAVLDGRAGGAGVRLALEPIHPADLTIKGCVNSIRQGLDLVQPLLATDLVIDTFHSAWDADIWRIAELAGAKAAVVQVCNWYEPSADEKPLRDLPSSGEMDLEGWLRTLIAGGYAGPIEFELFDRHRRGRSVEDVLNAALRELRDMIA